MGREVRVSVRVKGVGGMEGGRVEGQSNYDMIDSFMITRMISRRDHTLRISKWTKASSHPHLPPLQCVTMYY